MPRTGGPVARRKLIVYVGLTLDGFFQGPTSWDLDFFRRIPSREITEFCVEMERQAGTLLLGRRTYDGFARYWPTDTGPESELMNGLPKIVFSRTLIRADWSNSRIERRPPEIVVRRLKRTAGKDLFVFGSGQLVATLTRHHVVDEYWLHVYPVLLGKGKRLFPSGRQSITADLSLLEARPFGDNSVLLRYRSPPRAPEHRDS